MGPFSRFFYAAAGDLPLLFQRAKSFYSQPVRIAPHGTGGRVRPIHDPRGAIGTASIARRRLPPRRRSSGGFEPSSVAGAAPC